MHILLDPFTDPSIVKVTSAVMLLGIPPVVMATISSPKTQVMHGADWDVQWLQRDFGLYLVNLFDTGQASRVLATPRHSLAFLLQYCCGVQANKQYQLADWRIRLANKQYQLANWRIRLACQLELAASTTLPLPLPLPSLSLQATPT